ncbi:hypothetical protein E2C01_016936 [Portunus trituberculatus]|uniref:Uncharacterized protein n=1 Tax=Portunus trituberculatus TaxID=210409 RepID=A0A5B7DQZ2_PORTR|nr:hypothetical protein [Portunus trituberculatus]
MLLVNHLSRPFQDQSPKPVIISTRTPADLQPSRKRMSYVRSSTTGYVSYWYTGEPAAAVAANTASKAQPETLSQLNTDEVYNLNTQTLKLIMTKKVLVYYSVYVQVVGTSHSSAATLNASLHKPYSY